MNLQKKEFNLKLFLKTKKEYEIQIAGLVSNIDKKYILNREYIPYSKTYLKPIQKVLPNCKIEIPLTELKLYSRRQYTMIYKVSKINNETRKIYAEPVGLNLCSFMKTENLKPTTNVTIKIKNKLVDVEFKILYNKKNKIGKSCSTTLLKKIKVKAVELLTDLINKTTNQEDFKSILFEKFLNKQFKKEVQEKLSEHADFMNSISLWKFNLN